MTDEHEAPIEAEEALSEDVSDDVAASADDDDAPPPKTWSQEVEDEAKLFGWKAPDEWKGDRPPGYIDNPTDYMDRLSKSTPFRVAMEKAQKAEDAARKTQAALEAGHRRDLERQQQEYESRIAALNARRRQAAEEADIETYDRIGEAIQKTPRPQDNARPDDPLTEFYDTHTWLNDPVLRQHGTNIVGAALQSGELTAMSAAEQVAFAEEKLKGYFPHMFQKHEPPKAQEPPKERVNGGGMTGVTKRTGFESLPKDAREVFARQVKQGIFEDSKEDREFFFNEYSNG